MSRCPIPVRTAKEGYPGKLQTSVTYSISGGMELSVAFSAVTGKPTIVNLTNHSFFNSNKSRDIAQLMSAKRNPIWRRMS
jgi:galactose mutarotase-like enzyme